MIKFKKIKESKESERIRISQGATLLKTSEFGSGVINNM